MNRLKLIEPSDASEEAAELLNKTEQKLDIVPNMAKAMANAPAVLEGYLALSGAIIGSVVVNVFTNFFNRAAQPTIDFPEVEPACTC